MVLIGTIREVSSALNDKVAKYGNKKIKEYDAEVRHGREREAGQAPTNHPVNA